MNSASRCLGSRFGVTSISFRLSSSYTVPRTRQPLLRKQLLLPTPFYQPRRILSTTQRRFDIGDGNKKDKDKNGITDGRNKTKEIKRINQHKEKAEDTAEKNQLRRPWHRDPESIETLARQSKGQDNGSPRGKLLTTPTRLLKLILPLPARLDAENTKSTDTDLEPLALLVHPQQPLSYIERLLQAELPPIKSKQGREKVPDIYFRAEDSAHGDDLMQNSRRKGNDKERREGKKGTRNGNGINENVASYSGLGHMGPRKEKTRWVRWSGSTEVGDFIRDAARGREFAIEIEGYGAPNDHADSDIGEVRVAVPSFNDRTHYLRQRLRIMSKRINTMSQLKTECDEAAHRGAHRLAQGGFAGLVGWWGVVYYVSFHTDVGWDLVEPVTYLAGLTTIMGGYLWFLYISRDLSYRAALNVTVSRRQHALYSERGFDVQQWESKVHEANSLRREIRMVADEYDVEWDEAKDLGGDEVKNMLENEQDEQEKENDRKKRHEHDQRKVEREHNKKNSESRS